MTTGPKDFEKHIKTQLLRLSHLLGYPTESIALRDYIAALTVAQTEERATRVVAAFIGDSETTRCPTAAQIRGLAYDMRSAEETRRRDCENCGGSGFITVYRLVTYHGKSHQMKHSEPVPESEWRALAEKIAAEPLGDDRQQVLSAAKECSCRKRVLAG